MALRPCQLRRAVAPAVAAAGLALWSAAGQALALTPQAAAASPGDPLEGLNRGLYAVHRRIDRFILRPIAKTYIAVAPALLRQGISNGLANLGEPITVVNDVLQLRVGLAAKATARFVTNSTVGVGGLFDVAAKNGLDGHVADFGQTLGHYGVRPGPYLFIPVLGPTTLRDLGGRVVDVSADPVNNVRFHGDTTFRTSRAALAALDARAYFDKDIDELDRSATDPYVTLRSAYLQNRQSVVDGGRVDVQALPSFGPEPATPNPTRPGAQTDAPAQTTAATPQPNP